MSLKLYIIIIVLLISNPTTAQEVCKLVTMRYGPDMPPQIVELCTIPDQQERIYREMAQQRALQEQERQRLVPDIFRPWR
jgi:hypothetical protein